MNRVLPILFNTEMVRAILARKKTETRRVMKPANPFRNREGYFQGSGLWIDGYNKEDVPNGCVKDYSISSCWMSKKFYIDTYAPYKPGDILYVRETWCKGSLDYGKEQYYYKADNPTFHCRWNPSIHMPKAAARIWLRVTDVKAERLQDIDGQEVLKEGVDSHMHPKADYFNMNQREMFEKIWNSTIKKTDWNLYGWEANPWVWVIKFERCEKPGKEKN